MKIIIKYMLLVAITSTFNTGFAKDNPYMGTYVGVEVLEGGTSISAGAYALTIHIDADGRIRITDSENISATGVLKGNSFHVVRPQPLQFFMGTVKDGKIEGTTTKNVYTGDGTLSLELQK